MIPMPFYLYLGVAMWVALADGLEKVEKVTIIKRLEALFPSEKEDASDYFDELLEDFQESFNQTTEDLRGAIKGYRKIDDHREDLLNFARQTVLDDNTLTQQEELAISEIEKLLVK